MLCRRLAQELLPADGLQNHLCQVLFLATIYYRKQLILNYLYQFWYLSPGGRHDLTIYSEVTYGRATTDCQSSAAAYLLS